MLGDDYYDVPIYDVRRWYRDCTFGDTGEVKLYIETPDEKDGFHHMTVYLPSYRIEDEFGYSEERKEYFLDIIKTTANLITEFSKDDGFEHASGF